MLTPCIHQPHTGRSSNHPPHSHTPPYLHTLTASLVTASAPLSRHPYLRFTSFATFSVRRLRFAISLATPPLTTPALILAAPHSSYHTQHFFLFLLLTATHHLLLPLYFYHTAQSSHHRYSIIFSLFNFLPRTLSSTENIKKKRWTVALFLYRNSKAS